MKKIEFTSERRDRPSGGWVRSCRVGVDDYRCVVERGRMVRIPFKPRGKNRGWKWNGYVYGANGRLIWGDDVPGSIGVKGLLEAAGILTEDKENII